MTLTEWLETEVYPRLDHQKVFGDLPGFRRVGSGYMALCPLHAEKTASFSMKEGIPAGHCFGCGQTLSWWKYLEMRGLTGQQVIQELARLAGVPHTDGAVIFWSGEVEDSLVYARLVSVLAGTEYAATMSSFRRWEFTPAEMQAREELAHLAADKLYLVDALRSDIVDCDRLVTAVKNIARRQEITALFVDYLQILGPPEKADGGRYANREQEVTAIAKALHFLAVEMGIPVIAFAQINRNNYQYKEKPRITDLRESGGIEQYAQAVLGLWNSSIAGKREVEAEPVAPSEGWDWSDDNAPEAGPAIAMAESHGGVLLEVSVLKHRLRGNVGKAVPLLLRPAAGKIEELPTVRGPFWKEKKENVESGDESKKVTMLKGAKRK